ncbi:MAG TPA: lycopene cyclase domain-containing protein [Mycobacterium sp.]|jgi:lycopene cyclase domain-containing protein
MDHGQYLLLMAGCVLITLPLEFIVGARVYRSPRRLLAALLPTFVVFVSWDLLGIERGHWFYNPAFISGIHLGPIPLEELVFFIVIPLCGLLTYEAVGKIFSLVRTRASGRLAFRWPAGIVRESREGTQPDG